ncbi:MAG: class I SAM-dependent methyltransferase [Chloroflexi bacterium]|nr:class I SAM-dependent methyltransferase [Chloroflexota bacterium]
MRPPWDSGIPAPELVRTMAHRPPGRALDLGCGTGTNVRYLAEHGWQATGIDFVPAAIAKARRKLRGLPVTLLVGDVTRLEKLPLPGPYNLALDMGCFHSLSEEGRERYAAGLKHWMAPGSIYLLYAWQPGPDRRLGGLPRETVVAAFADGFTLTGYEQGQGRPSAWYYFERIADF